MLKLKGMWISMGAIIALSEIRGENQKGNTRFAFNIETIDGISRPMNYTDEAEAKRDHDKVLAALDIAPDAAPAKAGKKPGGKKPETE